MRKYLIVAISFLIGCSQSYCTRTQPEPVPPTPTVTATASSEPDAGPAPEPKQPEVEWIAPEDVFDIVTDHPDVCVFAFFKDVINNDNYIEGSFKDPRVVEILNNNFISMRFPITKKNAALVMDRFQITQLPSLIFSPADDKQLLQVEGKFTTLTLLNELNQELEPDRLFAKCAQAKKKMITE